jgi:hypothetical protein
MADMADMAAGPHEHVEVKRHSAGLFDIRNIIGSLVLIYGVVLIIMGLMNSSEADLERSDGFNINLWAGVAMTALGVFFILWSFLRPVVVQTTEVVVDEDTGAERTTGTAIGDETPGQRKVE